MGVVLMGVVLMGVVLMGVVLMGVVLSRVKSGFFSPSPLHIRIMFIMELYCSTFNIAS